MATKPKRKSKFERMAEAGREYNLNRIRVKAGYLLLAVDVSMDELKKNNKACPVSELKLCHATIAIDNAVGLVHEALDLTRQIARK